MTLPSNGLRTDKLEACQLGARPRRVGILNDYVRIPYANGSSFASQFLFREFTRRGESVTVLGPKDPRAQPEELPPSHVELPSLPLRNHPGVYMPFPTRAGLEAAEHADLDVVLGQSTSALLDLGVWLRSKRNVPLLCVNTVHLPSVYNVVLPDGMNENPTINAFFRDRVVPWLERNMADTYNQSDGVIVLSTGLRQHWRERGVRVPIHVIPRAVDPRIFTPATIGPDPFSPRAKSGNRLLVVCRHTREKNVERLLEIFAEWIAPAIPDATLTLVGDGPDHAEFKAVAERLRIADRTFFPGEYPVTSMPDWYAHADVFVYTSLSETYGQVVSEAQWCGLPVVAFEDGMGVSEQMKDALPGSLVSLKGSEEQVNWRFATEVLALLRSPERRRIAAAYDQASAHKRSDPGRCIARYDDAIADAQEHCRRAAPQQTAHGLRRAWTLARWSALHTAVCFCGLMRAPAIINRHGRKQPTWQPEPDSVEVTPEVSNDRRVSA